MQDFFYKQIEDGTWSVVAYSGDDAEITIPEEHQGSPVTVLYDDLFKGHAEITEVHIPDSVTDIGGFVFDGCVNLRRINLPKNLENMWQYAFARCGIEEIILPENVRQLVPFTFKDCKNLKKVVCNPGLREIGAWAFDGCDSLSELMHEPGKQPKINPKAFETLIRPEAPDRDETYTAADVPRAVTHPRIRPI